MLIPLILSGGSGMRLWPVSRDAHPKPFIKLADGRSLLQKTIDRLGQLEGTGEVITVTNREYFFATRDEYAAGCGPYQHFFVLEPCARNTAPAVAVGALAAASRHGPDAMLLVLPADHLVEDKSAFAAAVRAALPLAAHGALVTFGLRPDYPETGFGYIERGQPIPGSDGFAVARFTEKPSAELAASMVESGRYYWNAGMFCFRAASFLEEMGQHAPEVLAGASECWQAAQIKDDRAELPADLFATLPDISIDYAIMEKSTRVVVLPAAFGWSDVGSWKAVSALVKADDSGNRAQGECLF